jgi:YVTN family beta-propeller protein
MKLLGRRVVSISFILVLPSLIACDAGPASEVAPSGSVAKEVDPPASAQRPVLPVEAAADEEVAPIAAESTPSPGAGTPPLAEPGRLATAPAAESRYFIYISNEYDASVSVIDSATDEVIRTIPIAGRPGEVRPRGMAVSPDGRLIYVAVSDFFPLMETPEDKIAVIDVLSNEVVLEIAAGGNPERVAISPDGTQVWAALEAIAQGGGFLSRSGERVATFRTGVEPEGVAVSPDGRWVYVTAETTHSVSVFDRQNLRPAGHFIVGNRPREVIFSRDGALAYVSAEIGGTISIVDVTQHRVIDNISLGLDARPVEMALSPRGERLYVVGGGTNAVYVIDTRSGDVIATVRQRMGRRPWGLTATPDGKKVYTANGLSDSVSVIDTDCLCVVKNIGVGRGPHSAQVGVAPAAGGTPQ